MLPALEGAAKDGVDGGNPVETGYNCGVATREERGDASRGRLDASTAPCSRADWLAEGTEKVAGTGF